MCYEKIYKSINVDQPKADVFSQGEWNFVYYVTFNLVVREVMQDSFVLCLDLRNNYQARSTNHKEMFSSSEDKSCCGWFGIF